MRKLFLFALTIFLFSLWGCDSSSAIEGNGEIRELTRTVGTFRELEIVGEYELQLQEGTAPRVIIEADANLLDYIETEVSGKTLKIRNTEEIEGSDGVKLTVVYPELRRLEVGGAAKVSNAGKLKAKNLEIVVAGATMLELNMDVKELFLKLSGAGLVTLSGDAREQEVEMSGAGSLNAYELHTKRTDIELSGVGSAKVYATDELNAEVNGIGNIQFRGNPRNIHREVGGLGSIEAATEENNNL